MSVYTTFNPNRFPKQIVSSKTLPLIATSLIKKPYNWSQLYSNKLIAPLRSKGWYTSAGKIVPTGYLPDIHIYYLGIINSIYSYTEKKNHPSGPILCFWHDLRTCYFKRVNLPEGIN